MTEKLRDLSRLTIHSRTFQPWSLPEIVAAYVKAEVPGITLWRNHLEENGLKESAKLLQDSGLTVTGLGDTGFLAATGAADRENGRKEVRDVIDMAQAIGAPHVTLLGGAVPGMDLAKARQQILDGIHSVDSHAASAGVKLALEAQHPMYADQGSPVNTLEQANNVIFALQSEWVGLAIDLYHVWWDPFLRAEIQRAKDAVVAFKVCDWRTPTQNLDNDRGVMGDGCIPVRDIRGWVEATGFSGPIEVKVLSKSNWSLDLDRYLFRLKTAYITHA
jgi:sugar phosphate isomerase/epimerase